MLETVITIILAPIALATGIFTVAMAIGLVKGFVKGFNKRK